MKKNYKYQAHIQSIPEIRHDLQSLAGEWSMPPGELKQMLMIIEELFSNIVRYAYRDPEGQSIELELELEPEESALMICISDQGRAFNPLEYQTEESDDPVDISDKGMGLTLIRAFSESMDYKREKERNILTIRKSIFF